jgi:hypothetical protein
LPQRCAASGGAGGQFHLSQLRVPVNKAVRAPLHQALIRPLPVPTPASEHPRPPSPFQDEATLAPSALTWMQSLCCPHHLCATRIFGSGKTQPPASRGCGVLCRSKHLRAATSSPPPQSSGDSPSRARAPNHGRFRAARQSIHPLWARHIVHPDLGIAHRVLGDIFGNAHRSSGFFQINSSLPVRDL